MDVWIDGWKVRKLDGQTYRYIDELMDGWIDG